MCRMLVRITKTPRNVSFALLKRFVVNCRWGDRMVQDYLGHHNLGWGVAWLDAEDRIHAKRSLDPIWNSDWEALTKLKTKCFVMHARFALPWQKKMADVHPITIEGRKFLCHNGLVPLDAFPPLGHDKWKEIAENNTMDTRRYLLSILDSEARNPQILLRENLVSVLSEITTGLSANIILLAKKRVYIAQHHHTNLFKKYNFDLRYHKTSDGVLISSAPLFTPNRRIPNHTLITYDFRKNQFSVDKIE